jgi:hypothetical protein
MAQLGFQMLEVPFQTLAPFSNARTPLIQMLELPFQMAQLGFQTPEIRFQTSILQ